MGTLNQLRGFVREGMEHTSVEDFPYHYVQTEHRDHMEEVSRRLKILGIPHKISFNGIEHTLGVLLPDRHPDSLRADRLARKVYKEKGMSALTKKMHKEWNRANNSIDFEDQQRAKSDRHTNHVNQVQTKLNAGSAPHGVFDYSYSNAKPSYYGHNNSVLTHKTTDSPEIRSHVHQSLTKSGYKKTKGDSYVRVGHIGHRAEVSSAYGKTTINFTHLPITREKKHNN